MKNILFILPFIHRSFPARRSSVRPVIRAGFSAGGSVGGSFNVGGSVVGLFILLVCIQQVNAQVFFNPPTRAFATGTAPNSVTSADFNGDGIKDLATANGGSNNVSIFLGAGTGSFGTATNFSVGTGPYVVISADFDGDSILDLAACNGASNNVSVLLGTGTGDFGVATNFATGIDPRSVTSGDFNGDGRQDLATANYDGANVSVLLRTGTGSFGAPVNFATGTGPRSVISGNFNGDTIPDLAVCNESSNNVSVLIGTGAGNFDAPANFAVGTNPRSVTSADFDADGNNDLATANGSTDVSVLMGTGTGSFGGSTNFAAGTIPWSVTPADFNTDGNIDLAVADFGSSSVSVLLGTGTGSFGTAINFASTIWTVPANPSSLISGDFNGDSKPDLAIANNAFNSVSVLNSFIPVVGSCPNPMRIVILGASTSFGFAASEFDSAYAYLFRQFIIDSVNGFSSVINLAHAGYTTYEMQPTGYPAPAAYPVDTLRNITRAISLNPDGVIFNFTTNDVNALFPLDTTKNNFLRATKMLDSLGIPYWVTTTQPRNFTGDPPPTIALKKQMLLDLRDTIMILYPQNYIESYSGFADINGDILTIYDSGDHTHFNNAGHRLLFTNVKNKGIDSILCSMTVSVTSYPGVVDDLMLFPNPVTDELTVKTNNTGLSKIIIYDILSRKLLQIQFVNSITLNTQQLVSGIYIYEVRSNQETIRTGKVIKQ